MNRPEINVTPLIDVLLVLLIIFMVVTPMKPSSFDTRIPSEPSDSHQVDINTIVVSFSELHGIRINREETKATIDDTSELTQRLTEILQMREENGNIERTVFIKAPTDLDFGGVAKLIDAVKAGGAEPISLQIDDLE